MRWQTSTCQVVLPLVSIVKREVNCVETVLLITRLRLLTHYISMHFPICHTVGLYALHFSDVQWAYLCSVGLMLWLFGLEPLRIDNWESCAVFSISSSNPIMLCSSFSLAICSCCSFSSFLCCAMICCWTACLFSNLWPGDAECLEHLKPPPSPVCHALWSSAAVGATCLWVTCHGWVGWVTAPTAVLIWCSVEVSGFKLPDSRWPS